MEGVIKNVTFKLLITPEGKFKILECNDKDINESSPLELNKILISCIITTVARLNNVGNDVYLRKRNEAIKRSRQEACYFIKELMYRKSWSLKSVLDLMQGSIKNHASVLHGIKTTQNRIDTERKYREEMLQKKDIILQELNILTNKK